MHARARFSLNRIAGPCDSIPRFQPRHNARMTTTSALDECLQRLHRGVGVLVQVAETRGSAPREAGT